MNNPTDTIKDLSQSAGWTETTVCLDIKRILKEHSMNWVSKKIGDKYVYCFIHPLSTLYFVELDGFGRDRLVSFIADLKSKNAKPAPDLTHMGNYPCSIEPLTTVKIPAINLKRTIDEIRKHFNEQTQVSITNKDYIL